MGHTYADLKISNYLDKSSISVQALVDPLRQQRVVNPEHPNYPVVLEKSKVGTSVGSGQVLAGWR
jgi:hypothetical protein